MSICVRTALWSTDVATKVLTVREALYPSSFIQSSALRRHKFMCVLSNLKERKEDITTCVKVQQALRPCVCSSRSVWLMAETVASVVTEDGRSLSQKSICCFAMGQTKLLVPTNQNPAVQDSCSFEHHFSFFLPWTRQHCLGSERAVNPSL